MPDIERASQQLTNPNLGIDQPEEPRPPMKVNQKQHREIDEIGKLVSELRHKLEPYSVDFPQKDDENVSQEPVEQISQFQSEQEEVVTRLKGLKSGLRSLLKSIQL